MGCCWSSATSISNLHVLQVIQNFLCLCRDLLMQLERFGSFILLLDLWNFNSVSQRDLSLKGRNFVQFSFRLAFLSVSHLSHLYSVSETIHQVCIAIRLLTRAIAYYYARQEACTSSMFISLTLFLT